MRLVRQPLPSNLCGPAVVATVAGVDLERAVRACGRRGLTRARDLARGLAALGLELGERVPLCAPGRPVRPRWCRGELRTPEDLRAGARDGLDALPIQPVDVIAYVVRVRWPAGGSHWIAWWRGQVLDPADLAGAWPSGSRATAAYPVRA